MTVGNLAIILFTGMEIGENKKALTV